VLARQKLWIVLAGLSVTTFAYVMLIHDFLAITKPVRAEALVIEGWIWNRPALQEAVAEFKKGPYQCVICVGGPATANTESDAELAAKRLIELGIDKRMIQILTVSEAVNHRTYRSALAVHDWLRQEKPAITSMNVFTLGVHARKSHVLFQRACGPELKIGIIAGTESGYPVKRWWMSSTGIYLVLRNTVGYLYALVCSPSANQP
jgi:hypothetical protein